MDVIKLQSRIMLASDWICDIAQLKSHEFPPDTQDSYHHRHEYWKGAVRGEYKASTRAWDFFCPVWHTGQAIKSLLMASEFLKEEKYLTAAVAGADFILANQVWDPQHPDHGLILAYEDFGDKVNTSAILEAMHGLMLLADKQKSEETWQRLIAAGHFIVDRLYMPTEGLFRDMYDPAVHAVCSPPYRTKGHIGGRPLLDDGIMLKLYHKTGDKKFLNTHLKVSQTLVNDQNPPGNWIDYAPCDPVVGSFHPRHTYWWGLPLLDTYRHTKQREFLDTAIASGEFLTKAIRADGGYLRGYYRDGKTDSFGHATSGSACAAIVFLELFKETQNNEWLKWAEKALGYCMNMQLASPHDGNLKGAILEKVLPPDGTDRSPYYIRDLGTIFFIQAAINYLKIRQE